MTGTPDRTEDAALLDRLDGRAHPGAVRSVREIALALPGADDAADRAARDLVVVALSSARGGDGPVAEAPHVLHLDLDELAVPLETLRVAAGRLRTSPLYPLVRNHVDLVAAGAPDLASAAAEALRATTVGLVRALVLSAARDPRAPGGSRDAPTTARVRAYVAAHLRDPDLGPARIAAANAVSVRTLYTIYAALGTSLERSLLDQRLQGARTDLSSPGRRHHSIAAIARSWGFRNPSSFSQQFRRAFGVTPRQCRAERVRAGGP